MFENTTDYFEVIEFLSSQFRELNGYDFYKEIFPNCEDEGEFNTNYSKPNAIYFYMDKEKGKKRRRIMLQDKWEHDYIEYVEENEGTLCGGLTYRGRANKLMNAQQMNALIIDLDGVGKYETCLPFLTSPVITPMLVLCRLILLHREQGYTCIMCLMNR